MKLAFLIPLTAILGLGALAMVRSTANPNTAANIQAAADPQAVTKIAAAGPVTPAADSSQQIETGQVNWLRNLDEAKKLSASADKPILLLFQEIPG